jgi:WD40 repeat protein/serine/threonine protein kinase
MNHATPDLKSLFGKALEISSLTARAAFLNEACNGNAPLRAELDGLLQAHDQAGSFLKAPGAAEAITAPGETPVEAPGTRIGRYKLLQAIGEGGMGLVYMAEQEQPIRRRVALKIIKPGMDSAQVLARFDVERQALALMDHPNIARVLDAGTTDSGRPYFVMELVHGVPITRYCDANKLSPRQRLELFVPVCQAIQHAHQKGVIHRDLKPSNVMVTLNDGRPVPKVIDFGVAKATEQRLTERTLFTQYGTIVGTLEYMAPEQAEMSGLGVDTRSDVYALGVLLYELLTGTTPLERTRLREAAYDEMLRLIREEEPARPSWRISTSGDRLATISAERNTEPAQLSRLVKGELDWIVMRCLEKDRTRRYDTASSLERDIQHYLADEPVEACPPSAGYRLRKFARKHKKLLATTAAFAAVLLMGVAASAWQAVRATEAEAVALAERDDKEQARQAEAEQRAAAVLNEHVAQRERDDAQKRRDEVQALNKKLQATQAQLQRTLYAAHMNLAQHALDAGGVERVLELLEQYRPKRGESDLRGFEWHYLDCLCHSDLLTLNHTGGVRSVAYSPDGKRLASATWDKTVKVWDGQTGKELLTLKDANFVSVVFSPDGKRLATASDGRPRRGQPPEQPQVPGGVTVWDAQTGKELLTLKDSDGGGQVVFSPDGKFLARGVGPTPGRGIFGEVKVWDAKTGQETLVLKGRFGVVHSVAFSPDSTRLASGPTGRPGGVPGGGGTPVDRLGDVKVWDVKTGEELLSLKSFATSMVFSPDGKRLAIHSGRGEGAKVWDAQNGQELLSIKSANDTVSMAYSPDGKRLAGTSKNYQTVTVWDAQTGQELLTLKGHTGNVASVVFSPDGKRLASASSDKTVKVWDGQTGQEPLAFKERHGLVAFSPDGKRFAIDAKDRTVQVWDAHARKEVFTLKGHTAPIVSVIFSPDGRRLASAGGGAVQLEPVPGEVKMWDAQTGKELFTLKDLSRGSRNVAFSPDGKHLVSAGSGAPLLGENSSEVTVWDAQTGQERFTLKDLPRGLHSVTFSPDGKRLAGIAAARFMNGQRVADNEVKVWDAQTGKELLTFKGRYSVFSPDGKHLAGYSGNEAKIWDAQTGEEIRTLKGHTNYVYDVAFSPDGKRLATASDDKTVKVWDAQTGKELFTSKGHNHWVKSVVFSPDGKRIASASHDNSVKVWDAQTGQELLTLQLTLQDGHNVNSVIFSPDGQRLAGTSYEGTVTIWDATPLPEKP